MDEKYDQNVYLRSNIWVYNRIFVRDHTNKQTFSHNVSHMVINFILEMLSVENKLPAFDNLMSKETAYLYFVQVTLTLTLKR